MPKKKQRFEWDFGNVSHLWLRHKVRPYEAEEAMRDVNAIVAPNKTHSQVELRFEVIGKTKKARILFLVFTIRGGHVRVLHARDVKRKEANIYEEKINNT